MRLLCGRHPIQAFRRPFSALAAVLTLAAASEAAAQALQPGQCVTRDVFNQTIVAEGQRTIILGNGFAIRNNSNSTSGVDVEYRVNGISAREDGTLGYQFEGDNGRGTPSNRVCIRAVLTNIEVSNPFQREIPSRAYLGGAFNDTVNRSAQNGTYPMLVADTVFVNNGRREYGLPIVVFSNPQERRGDISTLPPSGIPTAIVLLENPEFTAEGLRRLEQRSNASPSQN